jgi:hypothetical protein
MLADGVAFGLFLAAPQRKLQLQLSHPELIVDLVGFLRQAELSAAQVGPGIVEVASVRTADAGEAERQINLTIRIWRLLHPAVNVVELSSSG